VWCPTEAALTVWQGHTSFLQTRGEEVKKAALRRYRWTDSGFLLKTHSSSLSAKVAVSMAEVSNACFELEHKHSFHSFGCKGNTGSKNMLVK
jgi:hypothetical protein